MKKTGIFLLILTGCLAMAQTKKLMAQMMSELTALKKFMVSEKMFSDTKNEAEIAAHLREFSRLAHEAGHDPQLMKKNFSFSRQILEEQILDTERVFRMGNKSYAHWQLNSLVTVCASCHTQMPANIRIFGEFGSTKIFSSVFDRAEFLFSTRAFDDALELYEKAVSGYPGNGLESVQVETALKRELTYYLRVKRDSSAALKMLQENQSRKNLWPGVRVQIGAWIERLKDPKKKITMDSSASGKQLVSLAKSRLSSDPDLITQLQISGLLYENLNSRKPSETTPEILYWLAVCDRGLSNEFFYSLADMYLKECISRYPHLEIAQKCYDLYENETVLSYTGSAGTHLPPEVRKELDTYKKLISPEKNFKP